MEKKNICYYGFSVYAEDFLLTSELQAITNYQQNAVIDEDENEIVKFFTSSIFSVTSVNQYNYLCIAIKLPQDMLDKDLEQYDVLIEQELNKLNRLVPRQCYIEWQCPQLFSLEQVLTKDTLIENKIDIKNLINES